MRSFEKGKDLGEEIVRRLLEAATEAPSAGNLQPWDFYTIKNNALKEELARAAGGQRFVAQAPMVMVVCADTARSAWGYGQRGASLYCLQDTAAAIQNMLLAATALGLGACWVGAFDETAVTRLLKLPRHLRPVAIVPIGHPARIPRRPPRRPLEEILHFVE